MEVSIVNLQKKVRIPKAAILSRTKKVLRHEGLYQGQLTIVFVSDPTIKKLNQKFLKHRTATDVLTFDYSKNKKDFAGEIIISADTTHRQAKTYQVSFRQEIILYVIHGILHLLGFDDHRPADIRRMRKKETELMRYLV